MNMVSRAQPDIPRTRGAEAERTQQHACVGCVGRQKDYISSHQTKPKQKEQKVVLMCKTLSSWNQANTRQVRSCYLLPICQGETFQMITLLEHFKGNGKQALMWRGPKRWGTQQVNGSDIILGKTEAEWSHKQSWLQKCLCPPGERHPHPHLTHTQPHTHPRTWLWKATSPTRF